jgi:hypothetical protein
MKHYKITYVFYLDTQCTKKTIGYRVLKALDRDHAILLMAMQRKLILKVETI